MSSALSESLAARVRSFEGGLYCHAPGDRPFDVEALARDDDGEDRWSTPGTSTIYLAGDRLVAAAEYARHGPRDGRDDQRRLVKLRVRDVCHGSLIAVRAMVMQQKTQLPVQFEVTEQTRESLLAWIRAAGRRSDDCLFPGRIHGRPHRRRDSTGE